MPRFVFVTGGVASSLGKGIISASIAVLLKRAGYKIRIRKFDPYLNVDPGTMSPYEHGEVFVTEDGMETDLDLGHYERFIHENTYGHDSISAGKVYSTVLSKERKGDYLGKTVQVIPHITNMIKEYMLHDTQDVDFVICEIGGTVGDIEGLPFLEAVRQIMYMGESKNNALVHLTFVPRIIKGSELKTKPSQHSIKELMSLGLQPQFLVCRCEDKLPEEVIEKLSLFCNIQASNICTAPNLSTIYSMPVVIKESGFWDQICKHFDINKDVDLSDWENMIQRFNKPMGVVKIGLVGKYALQRDAYKSIIQSLTHGALGNNVKLELDLILSDDLEVLTELELQEKLSIYDGVLVAGGFGYRGVEGKIRAIQYLRESKVPFFGICLGMQLAVVETARHLACITDANSTEFEVPGTPIIAQTHEWSGKDAMGGTMRLGSQECKIKPDTLAHKIYQEDTISERHRHRYEVNPEYISQIEKAGVIFSGTSVKEGLIEIIEIKDHPWFLAVQYHPEFKSRPLTPHPLFKSFIEASIQYHKNKESSV